METKVSASLDAMQYLLGNRAQCLGFAYPDSAVTATESGQIVLEVNSRRVDPGDWIIKNLDGSFSVCDASELNKTFVVEN